MSSILILKFVGEPLASAGLVLVYLILALESSGGHRRCYLMAAMLYGLLAILKLA